MNLREFVDLLEERGRLKRVTKEVDPVYEVAALMDEAGDTHYIWKMLKEVLFHV